MLLEDILKMLTFIFDQIIQEGLLAHCTCEPMCTLLIVTHLWFQSIHGFTSAGVEQIDVLHDLVQLPIKLSFAVFLFSQPNGILNLIVPLLHVLSLVGTHTLIAFIFR